MLDFLKDLFGFFMGNLEVLELISVMLNRAEEPEVKKSLEIFLKSLANQNISISFLFHFINQKMRIYVLTKKDKIPIVKNLLNSCMPNLVFEERRWDKKFPVNGYGSVVRIWGIPKQIDNPFRALSEFFFSNRFSGLLAIVIQPAKISRLRRFVLERIYRNLIKRLNVTESELDSREGFKGSYRDELKLKHLRSLLERAYSKNILKVVSYIFIPKRKEYLLDTIASMYISTISSEENPYLTIHSSRDSFKKALMEIFSCRIQGKHDFLLPAEASILIDFPRDILGIPIKDSSSTIIPPTEDDGIFLGKVMREGRVTDIDYYIPVKTLRKHVGIFGVTGFGKTNTCFNILVQLYKNHGIPFIVISPVKKEYRVLMKILPDIRIFTIGNEHISPFRLNPFEILEGISIQAHIDALKASFNAAFILYAPMPYVLEQCIINIYRKNGWDLLKNLRGKTPTLEDLLTEIDTYTKKLGYDAELTSNIRAALKTRLKSLMLGAKGAMLNSYCSISTDLLLEKPTIIELEDIEDEDEKAFLTSLLLIRIYEKLRILGETKDLRTVIVIEEAHRLFQNLGSQNPILEAADAKKAAIRYFSNMLSEIRSYGAGIIVIEQIPSKLVPDVVKNTSLKIVHRLLAKDDKEFVGATMRLDERYQEALTSLAVGEAFIFTENHPYPFMMKINNLGETYDQLREMVDDDTVKKHMRNFIEEFLKPCKQSVHNNEKDHFQKQKTNDIRIIISNIAEKFAESSKNLKRFNEIYTKEMAKGNVQRVSFLLLKPALDSVGPIYCDLLALEVLERLTRKIRIKPSPFLTEVIEKISNDAKKLRLAFYKQLITEMLSNNRNIEYIRTLLEKAKSARKPMLLIASLLRSFSRKVRKSDIIDFLKIFIQMLKSRISPAESQFYSELIIELNKLR